VAGAALQWYATSLIADGAVNQYKIFEIHDDDRTDAPFLILE
jgi:hypothetical protein